MSDRGWVADSGCDVRNREGVISYIVDVIFYIVDVMSQIQWM